GEVIGASPGLARALDAISAGEFSEGDAERYRPLVDGVRGTDWFMVAADFEAYVAAQASVDELWRDPAAWSRAAVHNTARMAWFSSDRTIREYARDVWNVPTA